MRRKELIIGLLRQVREQEQAFYPGLSEEELARSGSLESWSARDLLAHIASWKARMAENLHAVSRGRTPQPVDDYDQTNAALYEEHRSKTWTQVLEFLETSYSKLVQQIDGLSEMQLNSTDYLSWQAERPLWRLLVSNAYAHPMVHLAVYYRKIGDRELSAQLVGRLASSLASLDDSQEWSGVVKYNLACQYSLLGDINEAIGELREALRLNPGLVEWSRQDPDLDPLREAAGYQAIYNQLFIGG